MTGDLLFGLTAFAMVGGAVALALFILFRWFALWYWRVNEAVSLLASIDAKLERLPAPSGGSPTVAPPPAPAPQEPMSLRERLVSELTGRATG